MKDASKHDGWHSVYAGRKSLRSMLRRSDARWSRRQSWPQRPNAKVRRGTAVGNIATAALNLVDFKDATRARLTLFNDTSHYAGAGEGIPAVPEGRLSKWWSEHATRANER